jgi:hypothetical protein
MPKVSDTYSGQYLTAADQMPLGQRRRALIHQATQELVGQERKPLIVIGLVSARGAPWPKPAVLNKTNALQLAAAYGDDTDNWPGKPIEIWAENVQFQGRIVPGIKVLPASNGQSPLAPTPAPAGPAPGGSRQGGSMQMGNAVVPLPPHNSSGLVWEEPPAGSVDDEEIPF